ncbi:hypothetical protein MMC16_003068 [Acarospora aff. strigata]|nr:hypothetical protein [Acarospora aff. strigata]
MSQTSDPDRFFQTTTSIEEINRKAKKSKNTHGSPIRLQSKILAIIADPADEGRIYVAESAGTTGEKSCVYRGPTTPVTSVALSPDGKIVFAACWDKLIWSWDVATRQPLQKYAGHSDFVKTIICARVVNSDILVSGSADASIIVWDISTRAKLHTLKGHNGALQDLVIDPTTYSPATPSSTIFSGGSDREIRRWTVSRERSIEAEQTQPILEHETSVYKLFFDGDDDLWTASADGTAKCLSRERDWKSDTVLTHPDFVRDVVVDDRGGWVVTGCRDEEVRVWNRATGALHHTFSGHFEEVTGLLLVNQTVISVSIDATIRKWSLKPQDLNKAKVEAEEAKSGVAEEIMEPAKPSLMTAEEEEELADLMDDSE